MTTPIVRGQPVILPIRFLSAANQLAQQRQQAIEADSQVKGYQTQPIQPTHPYACDITERFNSVDKTDNMNGIDL
jgi:hypothetical protein